MGNLGSQLSGRYRQPPAYVPSVSLLPSDWPVLTNLLQYHDLYLRKLTTMFSTLQAITMLSHVTSRFEHSAVIFGVFSLVGTLGTLVINKLGGYLYDHVGHIWPFLTTLIAYGALLVLILVLKLAKKI